MVLVLVVESSLESNVVVVAVVSSEPLRYGARGAGGEGSGGGAGRGGGAGSGARHWTQSGVAAEASQAARQFRWQGAPQQSVAMLGASSMQMRQTSCCWAVRDSRTNRPRSLSRSAEAFAPATRST